MTDHLEPTDDAETGGDSLPALRSLAEPTPWMAAGACRGMDPNVFFPERGDPTDDVKAICDGCPVRTECLDYALRHRITFGIWGGTSERERRRLRRGRPTPARAPRPIRHGTPGGYNTHRRRGEPPCDSCRAAHTANTVAARRRRRTTGIEAA